MLPRVVVMHMRYGAKFVERAASSSNTILDEKKPPFVCLLTRQMLRATRRHLRQMGNAST